MRDEAFIRGNVPMTKSEVRAVSISKLELWEGGTGARQGERKFGYNRVVLYDIGAGTGSVAIEAALQIGGLGKVYAIERKAEAIGLIEKNRDKFGADNLYVAEGTAPEVMEPLTPPTHVFIGGSGGRMEEILRAVLKKNPQVRVVINAAALETLGQVLDILKRMGIEPEIVSVQAARAANRGGLHMMDGQNPVYVISFGGEKRWE